MNICIIWRKVHWKLGNWPLKIMTKQNHILEMNA